jgi:sulfate adenylyltransferase subunit 1
MTDSTTHHEMEILRFTTAGSVDDGKSTLIGRLIYDTKTIFEDQLEARRGRRPSVAATRTDLALLTDGLRAEREQGITIDVAYRYFATPRRKFIIADTPGHIQYTRNMVTGASTANLAIVLVDARKGVVEQTRRHAFIASLLRHPAPGLRVNKMDLVDWDEAVFDDGSSPRFQRVLVEARHRHVTFIPISALHGDNVVERSTRMPWYEGPSLLYHLEHVHIGSEANHVDVRFPVQTVIRPQSDRPTTTSAATPARVMGGIFKPGDEVVVLPSGFKSKIKSVETADGPLPEAFWPHSIVMTLEDEIDVSRGDMIVKPQNQPRVGQDIDVMLCWFSEKKELQLGGRYVLQHTSRKVKAIARHVHYKTDVNTLHRVEDDKSIALNEIGRVTLRTSQPLFHDEYRKNRMTGSVILIDEFTNETVAAGMIR